MNQKDYKEIAEIIKKNLYDERIPDRRFVLELADYFEREDKEEYWETHNPKTDVYVGNWKFKKQQFLKDCGVD